MFCENCGTQVADDSAFCQECGSKVTFTKNETQINEESINISKKPGSQGQRGPVPPVMRQTALRQPAPKQPSEPYGREPSSGQAPKQPSEPYRKEASPRQPSESYMGKAVDIIGIGQYMLMIFLACIPIINIILLVKWGFFIKQKPNKSNFAKALLFYYLIAVIIYVLYIRLWLSVTSGI